MTHTANEMMVVAAARALRNTDICFVGIGMPSAACNLARLTHAPDITLDLRIRHDRHQARRAAAVDRRRRTVRHRAHHGLGAGDVPLLAAGRAHHGGLPRRRADRPLRQSQHHGGRPLRQAEDAAARRRRRAGDRGRLRRDFHHHAAGAAQLRQQARFLHLASATARAATSAPASASRPRGRPSWSPILRSTSPTRNRRRCR